MPDEASDPKMRARTQAPVHAAAKRGMAAMLVQRNTKNCEARRGITRSYGLPVVLWWKESFLRTEQVGP